jgi:hypoxanthine phosphoribosyltransferase
VTAARAADTSSRRRNRRRSAARAARARTAGDLDAGAAISVDAPSPLPDSALDDLSTLMPGSGEAAVDVDRLDPDRPRPAFAHASEEEMARILDFYRIRWEYEPHTFPILWNLDGAVVESFSPDFWLPDLEMYLEMTTLRQKLVRKKNRKLRRIHELYPDIRVKLFYARDFRALMLKFGRLALVDGLIGSSGQVVPERVVDDEAGDGTGEAG